MYHNNTQICCVLSSCLEDRAYFSIGIPTGKWEKDGRKDESKRDISGLGCEGGTSSFQFCVSLSVVKYDVKEAISGLSVGTLTLTIFLSLITNIIFSYTVSKFKDFLG